MIVPHTEARNAGKVVVGCGVAGRLVLEAELEVLFRYSGGAVVSNDH